MGDEFPAALRRGRPAGAAHQTIKHFAQTLKFYLQSMMANQMQWCVAATYRPTWAMGLPGPGAGRCGRRWATIYKLVRVDQPDPVANAQPPITGVAISPAQRRAGGTLRRPHLDLTASRPPSRHRPGPTARWVGGSSTTPAGVVFH